MTHIEILKDYLVRRKDGDGDADLVLTAKAINEALAFAIHELEAPDWVKAGDGTLHGAITHWQTEALKEKLLRQSYQEQLCTLQDERARSSLAMMGLPKRR